MKRYLAFYSMQGADMGYTSRSMIAENDEKAEQQLIHHLCGLLGRGPWEYIICQTDRHFRVYNTLIGKRE